MLLYGLVGLGDYSSDTLCSNIPAGDPYRTPGNYCTQPSGNVMEFNDDGSINPDPFSGTPSSTGSGATPGATSQGSGTPWWATFAQSVATGITKGATGPTAPVKPPTPWYTTPMGIGGIAAGLVLLVVLLKR